MLLSEIYENIGYRIDEEEYDGKFDVNTFNSIVEPANQTMFRDITNGVYQVPNAGKIPQKTILSSRYLSSLVSNDDILNNGTYPNITDSTGVLDLSSLENTFAYFVDLAIDTNTVVAPNLIELGKQKVEFIDDAELSNREKHPLIAPSYFNYSCVIRDTDLVLSPPFDYSAFSGHTGHLTYLKLPTAPFLDYYVDSDDNYVFLTAGATGVSVPLGSKYRDGTAGATTVNSTTVELDFDAVFHDIFIEYILYILGLREKDVLIAQAAERDKQL